MKSCTHCKQEKPAADFSPNRHKSDGLQSWCRLCTKAAIYERRARPGGRVRHNAAVRSRNRAMQELANRHPEEFEAILDRERAVEGLPVTKWERKPA